MQVQSPSETAFPRLTDEQLSWISQVGTEERFASGEFLVRAGQASQPLWAIREGEVELVDCTGPEPRVFARHGSHGFIGDLNILSGRPALLSAIAVGNCAAIRVEPEATRRLLNQIPEIGDLLLDAFRMRRLLMRAVGTTGVHVLGGKWSREVMAIEELLYKNDVPYTFLDAQSSAGEVELAKLSRHQPQLPVVVCGGRVWEQPELPELARCLGITQPIEEIVYDLVIVGAGPTGLAAAVYASSEGLKTLVLDRIGPGGQAGASSRIENLIGFPSGISGLELAHRGYLQALKFGARFSAPVSVDDMHRDDDSRELLLHLNSGQQVRARCVLVATGVSYNQLDTPGMREFSGAGVYYAATSVEARLCEKGTAIVIGGGNSAGQAAMFLAERTQHVLLVILGEQIEDSMSRYLYQRILTHARIELLTRTEVRAVEGDSMARRVILANLDSGEKRTVDCGSVFVFIGAHPHTQWLKGRVKVDRRGFILTGPAAVSSSWPLEREPFELETSMPGLLAAGDVRSGTTKRYGFAVGDGALAVTCAHRVLNH
jgi:thioredoxin reductase (NADPH)